LSITIEPTGIRGERGLHYRVLHNGEVLVPDSWCPEYDAARALRALGVTGKVEVMRGDKVVSAMDLERAAELTIVENAQVGPKVTRWVPFSPGWVAPPAGVSGRAGVLEPASEDGPW
jgi:hypothetical protein